MEPRGSGKKKKRLRHRGWASHIRWVLGVVDGVGSGSLRARPASPRLAGPPRMGKGAARTGRRPPSLAGGEKRPSLGLSCAPWVEPHEISAARAQKQQDQERRDAQAGQAGFCRRDPPGPVVFFFIQAALRAGAGVLIDPADIRRQADRPLGKRT